MGFINKTNNHQVEIWSILSIFSWNWHSSSTSDWFLFAVFNRDSYILIFIKLSVIVCGGFQRKVSTHSGCTQVAISINSNRCVHYSFNSSKQRCAVSGVISKIKIYLTVYRPFSSLLIKRFCCREKREP